MARYSDNREQSLEVKQIRKLLRELDDRIVVPAGVSGRALRPKLDDVRQAGVANTAFVSRGSRATLRAGLAFAAAFVLVVGFLLSSDSYRPNIIEGDLHIEQSGSQPEFHNPLSEAVSSGETRQAFAAAPEDSQPAQPDSSVAPVAEPVDVDPANEVDGVGGGGMSVLLAERDGLSFRLRANDPNDPDRDNAPHTLEIVNDETAELVGQANIPDLLAAAECVVFEQEVVLVGESAEGLVAMFYDVSDPAAPAELLSLPLAGAYSQALETGGILRIFTLAEGEVPSGCEIVAPTEESDPSEIDSGSFCLVTTVDLATLEATQKAYPGEDGLERATLLEI